MRKHKSVVAILLAVMMIFTFMPTMAFADTTPETPSKVVWAEDGTSVSVTFGSGATAKTGTLTKATIKRYFDEYDGYVYPIATYASDVNYETLSEVEKKAYDYLDYYSSGNNAINYYYYYDFNFAKVTNANDWKEYTYAQFYNGTTKKVDPETGKLTNKDIGVYLSAPTYVEGYETTYKNASPVLLSDGSLEQTFYATGFTKDNYNDMSVTLSATALPKDEAGQLGYNTPSIGKIADNTVTVKGMVPDKSQFDVGIDDLDHPIRGTFTYDGKEHKIVTNEVPGYSIAYQVWNKTTKAWENVEAVTFKDAGTYTARYKAFETAKGANSEEWVGPFTLKVQPVGSVRTIFDQEEYVISGTEFDPWDFVVVTTTSAEGTDKYKAVAADNDALKAAAKEYFEITQKADKYDANVISLKIAPKTDLDKDAFYKAHKALFDNFYGADTFDTYGQKTATVYANVGEKDDDISFEGQTKFVYSGKKTTKKGVLKAKKTITVNAAADSGKEITFVSTKTAAGKIVVSKAGKITVKKGLKKGTYKVTVKAKTAAGNGYKAAKEKQTYTIVIKK